MSNEIYKKIHQILQQELKVLHKIRIHNKRAICHNDRYCCPFSEKFTPRMQKIELLSYQGRFHSPFDECYLLTCLHVFYNRFRERRAHTHDDLRYLETSGYQRVENVINSLLERDSLKIRYA